MKTVPAVYYGEVGDESYAECGLEDQVEVVVVIVVAVAVVVEVGADVQIHSEVGLKTVPSSKESAQMRHDQSIGLGHTQEKLEIPLRVVGFPLNRVATTVGGELAHHRPCHRHWSCRPLGLDTSGIALPYVRSVFEEASQHTPQNRLCWRCSRGSDRAPRAHPCVAGTGKAANQSWDAEPYSQMMAHHAVDCANVRDWVSQAKGADTAGMRR